MPRRPLHPVGLVLIGLGVVGLLMKVISNPLRMLEIFATIAAVVVIGVLLYKRFVKKRTGGNGSGYDRAVKQSAKKYKKQKKSRHPSHLKVVNSHKVTPEGQRKASLQKRKNDHNLKVIDGKKRKKKNRALF